MWDAETLYAKSKFNERYIIFCEEFGYAPEMEDAPLAKFINYIQDKVYRYKKEKGIDRILVHADFTNWMKDDLAKRKTSNSDTTVHLNRGI